MITKASDHKAMNHDGEGEGEIADEEKILPCHHRRRVTFRNVSKDEEGDSEDHCIANGSHTNGPKQQSSQCSNGSISSAEQLCDAERKEPPAGILRARSISPSPLVFFVPTKPRFELSKLSKAMRRSNETRSCIDKLKKQILQRLRHQGREGTTKFAPIPSSQISNGIHLNNDGENQPFLARQKRRIECLESTKAIMGQRLPPSMMPFVEDTLKAVHFLRRRRKENGHGRIVHKILVEQHKQVLKELERNENNIINGEQHSHSSTPESHKSKPS